MHESCQSNELLKSEESPWIYGIQFATCRPDGQNSRCYLDAATTSCRSVEVVANRWTPTGGTEEPCSRIGGVALVLSIQSSASGFGGVGFHPIEWHAECFTMMRCNHSIISREHPERSQHSRGPASARSHW